jgi:hypothetical protein
VFVKARHIKLEMTWMLSAEPWLNAAVVRERKQTYQGIELCSELWSTGAKAVSFLPSRPAANFISGVGQLPKSAPEVAALLTVFATAELLFAAVDDKEVWCNGQEKGAPTAYETDLFPRTGLVGG